MTTSAARRPEQVTRKLPVRCTALHSRADGLVNGRTCLDESCGEDRVEITGPHVLIAYRVARSTNRTSEAL